jgi:hypothetical protein
MQLVVAILKSLLILFLLLLLLGSGACVFIDISFLMEGFRSKGVSGQLDTLLMTAIAVALAIGAGYGIYAVFRSFRSHSDNRF